MTRNSGKRAAKARTPRANPETPKATAPASEHGQTPIFCFKHADLVTNREWVFRPTADHAPDLVRFICEIGRLTWREIEAQQTGGKRRHRKHHSQDVESLCTDAQKDFRRAKLGETFGEEVFRFRLSGEKRLWGFRVGRVFHAIWWDPHHKVYPTEPH